MKSQADMRMECLRLAAMLGSAKVLEPKNVVPLAMEFFRWVDNDPNDQVDTSKLTQRYRVAQTS